MNRTSVAVVGAGRMGLALAHQIASGGQDVVLLTTIAQRAATLRQHRRLKSVIPELSKLHERVDVTTDPNDVGSRCTLIFITISESLLSGVLEALGDALDGAHIVIHATHSLYGDRLKRASELIEELTCVKQIGVLAGPMHVRELLSGKPNAAVVASEFPAVIARAQRTIGSENFRIYGSEDIRGIEFAAALHQVVALAIGLVDGLQLGSASHASLVAAGLQEISSVGEMLGAKRDSFYGLVGVGRLVDALQRGEANYDLGIALARANDIEEVLENAPPEAKSVEVVQQLRRWAQDYGVNLTLVEGLSTLLAGELSAEAMLRQLMSGPELFHTTLQRPQ